MSALYSGSVNNAKEKQNICSTALTLLISFPEAIYHLARWLMISFTFNSQKKKSLLVCKQNCHIFHL